MPILVTCSCGQKLSAPDAAAGKTARCPKCGKVLQVPSNTKSIASPSAKGGTSAKSTSPKSQGGVDQKVWDELGLFAPTEGVECPQCHAELPKHAVLCIHCGYDFKTGRRLKTLGLGAQIEDEEPKVDLEPSKTEVDKMLDFAERELANEPLRQDMGYGTPTSAWLIFAVMLIVFALAVGAGVVFFNYMEGDAAKEKNKSSWVTPPSSGLLSFRWRARGQPERVQNAPRRLVVIREADKSKTLTESYRWGLNS